MAREFSTLIPGFTHYRCIHCGARDDRFRSGCPTCGTRGTMRPWREGLALPKDASGGSASVAAGSGLPEGRVEEIAVVEQPKHSTGLDEFDAVLDGGYDPGYVWLVGGTAGAGKSTCMLQIAGSGDWGGAALYVSGEESQSRLSKRARRLGFGPGKAPHLYLMAGTVIEDIIEAADRRRARFIVIDSIQTMTTRQVKKHAKHPTTMSRVLQLLCEDLRDERRVVAAISQITKEEEFAGNMEMQHGPDTLLYFETEGPRGSTIRTVRAYKNRDNATHHLGRFRIGDEGFSAIEVEDESGRDVNGPERGERLPTSR
jgi:DNA repair protein RadA/Sms